jgi:hypothetical protein
MHNYFYCRFDGALRFQMNFFSDCNCSHDEVNILKRLKCLFLLKGPQSIGTRVRSEHSLVEGMILSDGLLKYSFE